MLEYSWNDQLKSLGLTHAGVTALSVIAQQGIISQVKVASLVGVQAQTMGKTLARLESHGHVFRTRNTIDRRSYLLGITDEGRRVLSEAENIDRKLASVGELSKPEFRGMLINIIEGLKEQGGEEVLKSSIPHQDAFSSSYDATDSGEVNLGKGATEVKRVNTAVMDVITPEMITRHRSEGDR
ncbi:MarR family transcriptional regulator [Rothia sp. (in: high G+C Gram-positive bacteria)]